MALFSLCFGVLKVKTNKHTHQVFRVFDLCIKMAVTHFTTDEVVHRTMDILHDGVESNKQNMLREEGDAEVDSDDENGTGSDSDYQEKVLKKQMNPED